MKKLYVYLMHSGNLNQCGKEYTHWECSTKFNSKEALRKAKSVGRSSVKAREIYNAKQLIEMFGNEKTRQILLECKRFCPEEFRR